MKMILEQNETNTELEQNTQKYMDYLEKHITGVVVAFKKYFLPLVDNYKDSLGIYSNSEFILAIKTKALSIDKHDLSKYNDIEFYPYRQHFYPTSEEEAASDEQKKIWDEKYEEAWKHHYRNNPHHIEYWYDWDNSIAKDMDLPSIIEMMCDWFSMDQIYPKPEIDTWWRTEAEEERSMMTAETINTVDELYKLFMK